MRIPFLIMTLALLASGCQNSDTKTETTETAAASNQGLTPAGPDSTNFTTIEWSETTKNFGKITEGEKVEVAFHFKNTGEKPLVIQRVQPSCGCTVAETPEKPIAPGEEGVIKGAFDSNGRTGMQHKSLSVQANTKGTQNHELVFEVEVVKKS